MGLLRGGVPVAYEVARALGAPLDVWVVRKLGAPLQPELTLGAVAEGGEVLLDEATVTIVGVPKAELDALVARKMAEVEALCRRYRGEGEGPLVSGRTVIVVDDGVATGGTVRAAVRALRRREPKKIVVATPLAPEDVIASLRNEADDVVCVSPLRGLQAISMWYEDFSPKSDADIARLLEKARAELAGERARQIEERSIAIDAGGVALNGDLVAPRGARALVLFAHGSGSNRRSPRNRLVAERLRRAGFGTLLFDLLTPHEVAVDQVEARFRFNIPLLAGRLVAATDWACAQPELRGLRLGYFGAGTGAAAALVAAAERASVVGAVVSRAGRPNLAGHALHLVGAPTLLIVGRLDAEALRLNRKALALMTAPKQLVVIPGATRRFEEPGALERVADLAADWFTRHLVTTRAQPHP
jgi:putative phosphoribosyl transferase